MIQKAEVIRYRLRRFDVGRGILLEICLCQNDHRVDVGFKGERDVALQPGDVEISVTGGDHKTCVDVGRDQLLRDRCPVRGA